MYIFFIDFVGFRNTYKEHNASILYYWYRVVKPVILKMWHWLIIDCYLQHWANLYFLSTFNDELFIRVSNPK